MKQALAGVAVVLGCAAVHAADALPLWQQEMDDARRAAARGENTGLTVRPGSRLAQEWPVGVHVFYNAPRPFCYAYVVPGEWLPVPGSAGMVRSRDGRAVANVTFVPPARLRGVEGSTMVERGRNATVRELERALHQSLVDAHLEPFESTRPGTWQLKAGPVRQRDGRPAALPLYVIVDLSPHTVAEINVMGSGADEDLARQIVAGLRTTEEPGCYLAELERLLKAAYGER